MRPSFNDLLAQPGSSAPAPASPPGGGTMLNDRAMQVAMTNPIQAARIRKEQAKAALQTLAMKGAKHVV